MVSWRVAGINYVRYSQIAAEVVRKCVKKGFEGGKKPVTGLKMTAWEAGKQAKKVQ